MSVKSFWPYPLGTSVDIIFLGCPGLLITLVLPCPNCASPFFITHTFFWARWGMGSEQFDRRIIIMNKFIPAAYAHKVQWRHKKRTIFKLQIFACELNLSRFVIYEIFSVREHRENAYLTRGRICTLNIWCWSKRPIVDRLKFFNKIRSFSDFQLT